MNGTKKPTTTSYRERFRKRQSLSNRQRRIRQWFRSKKNGKGFNFALPSRKRHEKPSNGNPVRDAIQQPATTLVGYSPFTLPALDASIPSELGNVSVGWALGAIANGLIEAEVLSDADWNGDLISSINSALTRWINEDLGIQEIKSMPFELFWLDDFCDEPKFALHSPCHDGAFVLTFPNEPELFTVGHWINVFNTLLDGVGIDIYQAFCSAIVNVFRGMTPQWAYEECCDYYEWRPEEDQEDGFQDGLSPKSFECNLSEFVYTFETPDVNRLQVAMAYPEGLSEEHDRLRKAAALALEISNINESCNHAQSLNQVWQYADHRSVSGLAVRWQMDYSIDPTGWVMDSEIDMLRQGERSWLCVLIAFNGFENIPSAIKRLATVLKLATIVDSLIWLIEDDRAIEPPIQIQIPTQIQSQQRIQVR